MKGYAVYEREYAGELRAANGKGPPISPSKEDNIILYLKRECFMIKGHSKREMRQCTGTFSWPTEQVHFQIRIIPLNQYKKAYPKYSRKIIIESMPPGNTLPGELEGLLAQKGFKLEKSGIVDKTPARNELR
jgi:hypothetical protein